MKIDYQTVVHEIDTMYEELPFHLAYHDSITNGESSPKALHLDSKLLAHVERFIAHVSVTKSPLFNPITDPNNPNVQFFTVRPSAREFEPYNFLIPRIITSTMPFPSVLNIAPSYEESVNLTRLDQTQDYYSQNILTFITTINDFKKNNYADQLDPIWMKADMLTPMDKFTINNFVDYFRQVLADEKFQKKSKAMDARINKKYKEYCAYVNQLFKIHQDLTFICIEFTLPFNPSNKTKDLVPCRNDFFNRVRFTREFANIVGYLGKWEYSTIKNYYFRTIFILPSDQVKDAKAVAKQLSMYWTEEITDGYGQTHHARLAFKPHKLKKATCQINGSDKKSRQLFEDRVIAYITKSEKYYAYDKLVSYLSASKARDPNSEAIKNASGNKGRAPNISFRGSVKTDKNSNLDE